MRSLKLVAPFLFLLAACGGSSSGSGSSGSSAATGGGSTPGSSNTTSSGSGSSSGGSTSTSSSSSSGTTGANTPLAIVSTQPASAAVDVWTGEQPSATFNQAMDAATLTTSSFTLMQGSMPVAGAVAYDSASFTARFVPSAPLGNSLPYTATLTTSAASASGRSLSAPQSWSFTSRAANVSASPVNLGTAGNYVILAETQISTVPTSAITGDVAISPAAATYITGFSLTADSTNTSATSPQITGTVYAADYTSPTPANLTTAVGDMDLAFTDAAGRAADVSELGAGNIGGMTLIPGVYKWGSGLLIPTDLHLSGSACDVWIFEIAQDLTVSNGVQVSLAGGAVAKNVFWQVSGSVSLGTTSHFEGVILSQTAINLATGSSINGRLLAQSAVTLDSSAVVQPAP